MIRKCIVLTAFLCAATFLLLAQDSAYNQLNEVIVTANKYPQKQNETGKVITVLNKTLIEKSAGKTVAQLLNEQAGIVINGALSTLGSVQTVYMRGASSGRALLLIDGIPVNDPSMINNEFDLNFISLNDVEQIEICRGAQSTLYGSDAIAGVINIITTKKDVAKPFNAKATVTGGSLNTWKGNVQVYGKKDKISYAARYAKLYTDGFSAARDTTGKGSFDSDGYSGDAISARVQVQATSRLAFNTFMQYSRYKSDVDAGGFTDDKDYTIHNKNLLAGAGFTYTTDAVQLTGNFQYNELHRKFLNDSLDQSDFLKTTYYGKTQFTELYASIKLGGGFTLLQGGDYRYGSMNSALESVSIFGPYQSTFKDTALSQASLYSSLNFNGLNSKLNIELGGRLNVHSRYGSNATYTFNPSFAISNHLRFFGSIATGFKAPTLYQLYDAFSGNQTLQPEKSVNYEGGLQLQSAAKKWNARLVYFYRDIKNGIDFDNINYKYFNYTKQIVRGMEAEVNIKLAEALSLTANYTYLIPDETTQQRTTFAKDTTYKYLLRRPAHSLNATVGYQYKSLYISAGGKYVSRRYDAVYGSPDIRLNAYFLLGAYTEYKIHKKIRLFADAQNVTGNKFYDVYGYNSIPFLLTGGITISL